uniref:FH2 domain-containing protein n=1 Tax=Macrostomum lignano TaxID=282301 RepID=A0A1I8FQW9_9PLAT
IGRIVEIFKRGPSFPLCEFWLKMSYRPEDAVATLDSDRLRRAAAFFNCSDEECSREAASLRLDVFSGCGGGLSEGLQPSRSRRHPLGHRARPDAAKNGLSVRH